ncbi:MAG: hypothetical protein ACKO3N_01190 [Verrucomicrobiota bacterium]
MKRKQYAWSLPAEIESRLGDNSYGRQRAIEGAGHLLLVLHAPPGPQTREREAVVFLRRPDGQHLCNGFEGGEQKLRKLLADYRARWEELDEQYDNAASADELFQLLERLTPLNRASTNLAAALQSARDLVRDDRFLIGMRDEAYDVSRAFELLLGDARLKLDYRTAKDAESHALKAAEIATAQHKLNILAAVTFPVMALATLLGMNVLHGLENRPLAIFWVVLLLGAGLGFGVKSWVTRNPAGR